jgi:hypothetical protein
MTLPTGSFVCKGIDPANLTAAARIMFNHPLAGVHEGMLKETMRVVSAALGEVIPAEVEHESDKYPSGSYYKRYATEWQPVEEDTDQ